MLSLDVRNVDLKVPSEHFKPLSEYVYANGRIAWRTDYSKNNNVKSLNKYYYNQDILGSTIFVTDTHGHLAESYKYDAFGKEYEGELNNTNRNGYIGKVYDPSVNLYNYGFRDYNPGIRRWTSVDPVKDGVNWYAYAGNNPVNFIDLWGLQILLSIYNADPTLGNDKIADISSGMDPGHTWMGIDEDSDGNDELTYGFGHAWGEDPSTGGTVTGAVLTFKDQSHGLAVTPLEKEITPEQQKAIMDFWDDLTTNHTGYNFGGKNTDANSTFCTESVVDVLEKTGVLSPEEAAILDRPYDPWSERFPDIYPSYLNTLADTVKDLTSPNPNEFEERLELINAYNRLCGNP